MLTWQTGTFWRALFANCTRYILNSVPSARVKMSPHPGISNANYANLCYIFEFSQLTTAAPFGRDDGQSNDVFIFLIGCGHS